MKKSVKKSRPVKSRSVKKVPLWRKWFILGFYAGTLCYFFLIIDSKSQTAADTLINFVPAVFIITLVFLFINQISKK